MSNTTNNPYKDKLIVAPMVRASNLPFRLLCLRYGADLAYSEELIDHRLSQCRRLVNKVLKTIDFVDPCGDVVLRTCEEERGKLVLQIGSNDSDRALRAARLAQDDIVGLDFNFGCPKPFSLSGGMGAALLEKPEQIENLLKTCVKNLAIPVTCKIRILPNLEDTIELGKLIESCGVSAIAVHGRTKDQRSRHDNRDDVILKISESLTIPVIANGGSNWIKSYSDIIKFRDSVGASSVMIARAAMRNPSVFCSSNSLEPVTSVISEYLKLAVKYDNPIPLTKYTLQSMMSAGHFEGSFCKSVHQCVDYKSLCKVFDLSDWFKENEIKSRDYYDESVFIEDSALSAYLNESRKKLEYKNYGFICDDIAYCKKFHKGNQTPKAVLMEHSNRNPGEKLVIDTVPLSNQHRFCCMIEYKQVGYINKSKCSSKRMAEQATAYLVCRHLGLLGNPVGEHGDNEYEDDKVAQL